MGKRQRGGTSSAEEVPAFSQASEAIKITELVAVYGVRFCDETMMDQTELRQLLEEIEYECEVLIQARFHFRGRKDDKLGHVTTAWVELHKLHNVGRETVERKIKEY